MENRTARKCECRSALGLACSSLAVFLVPWVVLDCLVLRDTLGRILHNVGTSQLKRRGCIIHMPCMHDLGRALSDDWNARRCSARHIFGRYFALYFCCTSTDDRLSREIRISRSFRSVTPGPSFSNDRYQRWSNRTDR